MIMKKNILTLQTALFEDADILIEAANAPVLDLRIQHSPAEWDDILEKIMDADLIVTA